MSHTLTASLKQALLSLGFLIAFTGVVVVLLLAAFEDVQHFSIRYNKFRKKKRHGLQKSGRMKLRHAILKGDNKPCPKRLYS